MTSNFITRTDSYKLGHPKLYPDDLEGAYAYFESRGGRYPETLFFGLQYYLYQLAGEVFNGIDIMVAEDFANKHFGRKDYFDAGRWRSLLEKYDGALPLRIRAVPEGSLVPTHNVLFTVEATDPEFAWLVGHVETTLMKVWYPITVATQSFDLKRRLAGLRDVFSDNRDGIDFMIHDFGYRGCTSEEQAQIGGAAHLLSFKGTDTLAGIGFLQDYYGDVWNPYQMHGFSVPATEHSIVLAYGEENEEQCYAEYLERFPSGIIACVSDTYDIDKAVDMWTGSLKDAVMKRDGTLVIRPDSGDPQEVVLGILRTLWSRVGGLTNTKGLRLIDSHYRVIQGDGMDYESIPALYDAVVANGFAPENLTVGAGGGMLQKLNRDTQRFAYKVSEVVRDGQHVGVAKHPKSDPSKTSKKGRVGLRYRWENGRQKYFTVADGRTYADENDAMQTVFENGDVKVQQTIHEIRERVEGLI